MGKEQLNPEFVKCLEKGKIRPFPKGKNFFQKELETAEEDLEEAKRSYKDNRFKWTTIQAYFAMFHTARALIYFQGYRERSHYCLIVALKTLFVSEKLLDYQLVEMLQQGKKLRENADYYGEWSEIGAYHMLESAEQFIKRTKEILKKEQ